MQPSCDYRSPSRTSRKRASMKAASAEQLTRINAFEYIIAYNQVD